MNQNRTEDHTIAPAIIVLKKMRASQIRDEMNAIRRTRSILPSIKWKPTYTLLIIIPLMYALVSISHTKRPTDFNTSNNDLHETSKVEVGVDDPSIQHTTSIHPSTLQSQMNYSDHNLQIYLNKISTKGSSSKHYDYPLVDFAVIGFAKCGTTMLENVLNIKDHAWISVNENHDLESRKIKPNGVIKFVKTFEQKDGKMSSDGKRRIINGFKSPSFITSLVGLLRMEVISPNTNFLVSTRHPVYMFESYYNYRTQTKNQKEGMKTTVELIGDCGRDCDLLTPDKCVVPNTIGVCTAKATYHEHLSRLGLTRMTSSNELDLLGHHNRSIHPKLQGNLFLVEENQLRDDHEGRLHQIQRDIETFLGLDPNVIDWDIDSKVNQNKHRKKTINICDADHDPVREVLLQIGFNASEWIKEYLVESPRVTVSNKENFLELIDKWKYDPCQEVILT